MWRGAAAEPADPEEENTVALRVNARAISSREIEAIFRDSYTLIQDKLKRGELKPEAKRDAIREAWKSALQTAIQDQLLDELGTKFRQEIKARIVSNYSPGTSSARIEDAYRRWEGDMVAQLRKQMIEAAGGEKALRDTLTQRGQNWKEWERGLLLEIFRREVLYFSLGPVSDSPAASKAYFEAHPEEFSRPDAWRLRHIRIPKDKFTSAEETLKTAELIRKKLAEGGVEFGEVAAALKYDPATDTRGGLLTVDGKTDLPSGQFPAEERIAKGLKDGEISKPVEVGDAFLIVKREGYKPALKLTWEEAADMAAGLAFTERLKKKKLEFFEKQKSDAYIEIVQKEPPEKWLR
ncbi:MAG: peptidyl-prolyl cis-trans isomerase [Planctomycetes bacterium]|nr:peptidyl-prolyl cis-trans isomerase [Planctomycetota bacterium]